MTRRDHEDLGDAELSPEDEARAEDAIQQAELDLKGLRPPPSVPPCPEGLEPPWVIVDPPCDQGRSLRASPWGWPGC